MYSDTDEDYFSSKIADTHCAKHYFVYTDSDVILDLKIIFFDSVLYVSWKIKFSEGR
jgi:hypothetical protein